MSIGFRKFLFSFSENFEKGLFLVLATQTANFGAVGGWDNPGGRVAPVTDAPRLKY
jgi:hypothetical protein